MTSPDDREQRARDMLRPYEPAMSTSQLAALLAERTTGPVLDRIKAREFPAIRKGHNRYSIPTETLIPWLAARLTTSDEEEK